jgi:hypothetical protein
MKPITLVLVSHKWTGQRSLKIRGTFESREAAGRELDRLHGYGEGFGHHADYRIVGPRQLKELQAEIKDEQNVRRKAGAIKAGKTRKQLGKSAFILCPQCGAKSKKLYSEFGGLQTRVCQKGHNFEYDKWRADRPLLGM